jgi:hypothetical protein
VESECQTSALKRDGSLAVMDPLAKLSTAAALLGLGDVVRDYGAGVIGAEVVYAGLRGRYR